ncbi:MAG TPA: hypothetical protein V6C72_19925, partial [Chroococcales cyanobacterium]
LHWPAAAPLTLRQIITPVKIDLALSSVLSPGPRLTDQNMMSSENFSGRISEIIVTNLQAVF